MPQNCVCTSRDAVCLGLKALLLQLGIAAEAAATDAPDARGFTLSAAYTADFLRNASGGLKVGNTYLDNLDLTIEVDGERAFGMPGLEVRLHGLYNNANRFSERFAGDALVVSNIDGPRAVRLYEAWAQWTFANEATSVRAGLYDLNSEFDVSDARGALINSSFGVGHDLSQSGVNGPSIFPSTSLALRVSHTFAKHWTVLAAALDGVPGDPDAPARTRIDLNRHDGALFVVEAQRTPVSSSRLTKLAIGAWEYSETFERIDDRILGIEPQRKAASKGAYALADFMLWQDDARSGRRLEAFARVGTARDAVNAFGNSSQAGIIVRQPFRVAAEESLGLAITSARTGAAYRRARSAIGAAVADAETVVELTYRRAVTPWLVVQPDMQYILNPGADRTLRNALVLFLRVELSMRPADRS